MTYGIADLQFITYKKQQQHHLFFLKKNCNAPNLGKGSVH
jgi:hypothetical protein